ncbi:hypothetical protein NM04_03865 [Massilia aurea]|uniref:Toxin VasX N-terminal region domain-containing protein n=1 Tax=Massilia aurea TaxID=373040 RepID=A0A422QPX0_9BURK|nr:T6SS effector BTH_I2691 family protein [Massilia aurea]RNF32064.1 hypothetical protein NM04_03865 [Massilia aurea]
MQAPKKCEFCDKRGLPLLLVRDAVAPSGSGVPAAKGLSIALPSTTAYYTKRLLRSGYVNVYDEARRRWDCYFVTPEALLYKLSLTSILSPLLTPTRPFNCTIDGHREAAGCITISDPRNATSVWIGFSDTLWTEKVRKANEDREVRRRHMVEVDVRSVMAGKSGPHDPIRKVDAIVAEYSLPSPRIKPLIDASPFRYCANFGGGEKLVKEFEGIQAGKGLIVTVPDPAGIVQELAFLMTHLLESFLAKNPTDQRNLAASAGIDQIKSSVIGRAETEEIEAARMAASKMEAINPLGHVLSESTRNKTSKVREVTADELDRATASAWSKYDRKFDDATRQRWRVEFDAKLKAFDQQSIAPLALRHVEWFKSATFTDYFEFNYDPSNALCGVAYTNVVTSCLAGTQDKACCNKLYEELLQGNFQDKKNVLLRASILNQSAVAESIEESSKIALDSRQIPWDSLFEVYKAAMQALDDNSTNGLALYIAQISGPVARILGKIVDGRPGFHKALMMLGFISGDAVTVFEVSGKRSQFVRYLAKQMIRTSGAVISENQLRVAVSLELERLRIRGMRVEGSRKLRWVVSADSASIENLPGGMSRVALEAQLKSSLRSVEQLESLRLERWRSIINQKVRWGVVTGILQAVCLTKVYEDEETSLANEKQDARWRRVAAISGLVGTTCEVIGSALRARAAQGILYGQRFLSWTGAALMQLGRIAGAAAGLLMAVLDMFKAVEALKENGIGLLFVAYAGSAFIGLLLTLAILSGAAFPVTLMLVALYVAVGLLIEFVKDDRLQDWLERCPWGLLSNQRYISMKIEQEQLTQAFK